MSQKVDKTEVIYDYLVAEWIDQREIPSYREIAAACELSVTATRHHLDKLEGAGRISREPNKARSIRLVEYENTTIEDSVVTEVYQFIRDCITERRIPTQNEIADECFMSRTSVRHALSRLEGQGKIRLKAGMRGIHLVD